MEEKPIQRVRAKPEPLWRPISEIYQDGLKYMEGRQKGLIKSIVTPFPSLNDVGVDGLEWQNIIIVAGRPGSGKTLLVNQITREAFALNPNEDFACLDFQWEMIGRTIALREFASQLKTSMRYLNSSDRILRDDDMQAAIRYVERKKNLPIFVVEKPQTVEKFKSTVREFVNKVGKKTIVTVDHSVLFKRGASEGDMFDTLYVLGDALTELKKELPVMFIVLSQLNRNCEAEGRLRDGHQGNYLLDSDMFGADGLLQHTDILAMINRPAKYNIKAYGPERFEVSTNLLAIHYNKVRNGAPKISFYNGLFDQMRLEELDVDRIRRVPKIGGRI